jgi:hypothetical protein
MEKYEIFFKALGHHDIHDMHHDMHHNIQRTMGIIDIY